MQPNESFSSTVSLYHPFYPDVTHVRKDTRPSPAFPYYKQWKAGWGLGMRLESLATSKSKSRQAWKGRQPLRSTKVGWQI